MDKITTKIDVESFREKYRQERDKRLKGEGSAQYKAAVGDLSYFVDDPYVVDKLKRGPINEESDVIIVGGGFSGLVAGARLGEAGLEKIRIIEKGADFGGTWYWNRYPGAQCDIESYIYLPLLEETGYIPTEKYAYQPEIYKHAQRIGKHFNLYRDALFQAQVTEMRWDDELGKWHVTTNLGDHLTAQYVVISGGPLSRPKLPGIDGINDFEGHVFHTSRWDYDYTGGDASGGLNGLRDKRVGVIGTGATGIQTVPFLGEYAEQLYVFQRTPSSVSVRGNLQTRSEWIDSLEPGWQQRRRENFTQWVTGNFDGEDLVSDSWTSIFENLNTILASESSIHSEEDAEIADILKMNEIRARVDEMVDDEATAELLKPWYRLFCKRPTFNDEYLPTFNRPNVSLIDTQGQGVDRFTKKGAIVAGKEYELDCLVLATGFEVGTPYNQRMEFDIYGRGGQSLGDHWQDGMRTLHGLYSHGFPNCFHLGITQTGVCVNYTTMIEEQVQQIVYNVRLAKNHNVETIQPTKEAEAKWVETIRSLGSANREFYKVCTPSYYNDEGKVDSGGGYIDEQYGLGPSAFFKLLKKWREDVDTSELLLK